MSITERTGMNITVNGEARSGAGARLVDVVAGATGRTMTDAGQPADGGRLGVAVALNSQVVPRSRWAATLISEGDSVEIVTAVQGG